MSGIIGRIWNIVAGSMNRSGGAQISDSVAYITNTEKCSGEMESGAFSQIGRELKYVTNDIKTLEGLYVGCRHISDFGQAVNEMMQVKTFYGKTDGRVALHGVVSLEAAESDISNAGKLMLLTSELLGSVFPDHQAVFAVHTNTENLHAHFIVNTVGMDGKKIHMDRSFMRKVFDPELNRLAVKYGLTPNDVWMRDHAPDPLPFDKRKMMLRDLVDRAIENSESMSDFVDYLNHYGVRTTIGRKITLRTVEMPYALRISQLGAEYTPEMIYSRILEKRNEMIRKGITENAITVERRDVVKIGQFGLPSYDRMTTEQKQQAVRLLRMGRNPWEENYRDSWIVKKLGSEISDLAYVQDLIKAYAPGETVEAAMREIIRRQHEISEEKKQIKENFRHYKPIIEIYEQMKSLMLMAYMYEHFGREEYQKEYERYKALSERLVQNYGKEIDEVAAFIADQRGKQLYLKAQERELSDQYRALKHFLEGKNKKQEADISKRPDQVPKRG